MKKFLTAVVIIGCALAAFLWFRKAGRESLPITDRIIVGTSADYPPFSFRATDDSIAGFDIDIVKEVAKRLSLEVNLEDKPFGTLLPQIELGHIHVIAAGMTPTEERAKHVTFTRPYLTTNPLLVLTRKESPPITKLEELKGKRILVNTGYTADLHMSKFEDIDLVRLPKVADALVALDRGRADAFVTASFTLHPYLDGDTGRYNTFLIPETDEQNALAISKNVPPEFAEKIQAILDDMEADGTLATLKQKWKLI